MPKSAEQISAPQPPPDSTQGEDTLIFQLLKSTAEEYVEPQVCPALRRATSDQTPQSSCWHTGRSPELDGDLALRVTGCPVPEDLSADEHCRVPTDVANVMVAERIATIGGLPGRAEVQIVVKDGLIEHPNFSLVRKVRKFVEWRREASASQQEQEKRQQSA